MDENRISDELVYFQTDLLTVTIKGTASHPAFPGVEFKEKESLLQVACDDPFEISLSGDAETLSTQSLGRASFGTYRLQPLFFEQQRYEIVIEPEEGHKVEFWHENYNIRKNVTPVGRKSDMLSGVINFGNEIGMSDLVVLVDGKSYLKLTIEIFPSKIGYKDDYKAIVADVTAEVYNLVFDFLKKTYDSFDISANKQSSPVEFFAIIRRIYDEFLSAADMVIAKPHHMLETEHVVLPNHKIKRTDNGTLRWLEKHPDRTIRSGDRVMVERALAVKKHVTYDTKENCLTKYMLQSTVKRLEYFKRQYLKLSRDTDLAVVDQIDIMINSIQRRYNTGFLKEVEAAPAKSGMSLVFSMAPGYRDLYRCYLLLQHGLSVTGSVFNVSVKDLAVLYEYWCFIKLNSLMKARYELLSQDIIKVSSNGLFVSLIKGQRSRVRYRNPENGEVITLSYNPKEVSGVTVPQKPDNVLSLKKKGAQVDYEYVFDAKYKINPAMEGSTYQKMYKTPGPQEDDINTMHRYRDAIVYQSDASPFERTMFGAYVLFPYKSQEEYRNHHFYQSIEQVNIGGLPFLPSTTELVTEMLDELISDSPESAFERATLPTGIEDRLVKVDWTNRDVLIGTLRSNAQLQVCLEKNFYYIPANLVKDENLPIHYVALFQTPRIFSDKAGIHYYGEVLRTALVRRKNIHEVPQTHGNPDDLYYWFQIKEWILMERPILPKESGFVYEFTNMFLMENVEYVPELLLRSEEEYRFYTELKRRTGTALDNNESSTGFELGDIKVVFEDGQIQIYKGGKTAGTCNIIEFSRQPNATFRRLQRCVSSLYE
mgnify:FL=1